jgi:hypothetical protein
MSSKFREHLSIKLPHADNDIEKSKFSPVSTISPSRVARSPKDIEAGVSPSGSFRDRLTKFFFDLRALSPNSDTLPVQDPHLSQWPPLHVQKRRCTCNHPEQNKKKHRRSRLCCLILLIIILLWLIANIIFLNIRVLTMTFPITTSAPNASTTSTSSSLSANAQQCLSQYTVNAPSAPSSYPCSTCLPTLQAVPSTYLNSNPQNAQQIVNAIQFCGLRGIFDTANSQGQATLGNGSWVLDVKFCAWNGVICDGSGRVANL